MDIDTLDDLKITGFDQLQGNSGNLSGISNEVKVFTQLQQKILNKEYLGSEVID